MANMKKNAIPNVLRQHIAAHAFAPSLTDTEFCIHCNGLRGSHLDNEFIAKPETTTHVNMSSKAHYAKKEL